MGLSAALARFAVRDAHVFVVETPGSWVLRCAVEREVYRRGWRACSAPASADVLVVAGAAGPDLAARVDLLWEQVPGPRTRVTVHRAGDVGSVLTSAAEALVDDAGQRRDAAERATRHAVPATDGDMGDMGDMGHGDMGDMGDMGHGDMGDMGGMGHSDMGDMGGMGHGDMGDMAPEGISLAAGGEDRDGLEMDVLEVPIGPLLPGWPAGLVLTCRLQGDVIVTASLARLDADPDGGDVAGLGHVAAEPEAQLSPEGEGTPASAAMSAARRCDNLAAVLTLAGWEAGASGARQCRDLLLDALPGRGGHQTGQAVPAADAAVVEHAKQALDELRRRLRRSRLLRWSLRGLGVVDRARADALELPDRVVGDAYDRVLATADRAVRDAGAASESDRDLVRSAEPVTGHGGRAPTPLSAIAALLEGLDLAAARLVLASLDLDPPALVSGVARA